MSYDIRAIDNKGETVKIKYHFIKGGTYAVFGSDLAEFNMTYNYSDILNKVIKGGIWALQDIKVIDSIKILNEAIMKLKDKKDKNYWKSTEGNVKEALKNLRQIGFLVLEVDKKAKWNIS